MASTALSPESLAGRFQSLAASPAGLTAVEAQRRLSEVGPNEPAQVARAGPLVQLLRFCANPLVLILLAASIISAILGDVLDATIIATMVALSVLLNFFQAYRSQRAIAALRERVAPTASVLRDGNVTELDRRLLVPGDIIRLSAGDLVPADAQLITSRDLHLQQAALTGESMPVEKSAALTEEKPAVDDNLVLLGSSVVSGTATALVIRTGRSTSFGDIAARLAARRPETEFDRGTRQFGFLIMETVFFLVLFIVLVNVSLHRNALESLLFAVALAVGLTPEFLPMITTVTLAMGAVRMAERKVIVKHLSAIEDFGSIDILCSDKTGTLTSGLMALHRSVDPMALPAERVLFLAWLNSHFETGIKSPLDEAILKQPRPDAANGYGKLDEIPFDFERRRLSIAVESEEQRLLITKGAPESIMEVCSRVESAGGVILPLDEATRERCRSTYQEFCAQGLRALAVAYRPLAEARELAAGDEAGLILAGFLTFVDPLLEGVADSLAALARDGVGVKILTGDNELVTRHICEEAGIPCERMVLGSELNHIDDQALAHLAEEVAVFARVSPGQKNRIIRALRQRSHVVGFLGDGINDAPSLHAADVGISVAGAVDVARDAADIILTARGLDVLHAGIVEGRKAFGNVMKYLLMGTSSNFGNMFSMAAASVFLPFLPMLPTQILLNNFLYDLAQITIPTDNVDPAYIRKPQRWNIRIIRNFMLLIGPVSSLYDFLTFYVLLRVFNSSQPLFHTGWFIESLSTQTLVLFVIRTAASPWSNRPSLALAMTTTAVVVIGILLPYSPLAVDLGFTPPPPAFFVFLVTATATYLALVELVKRRLMRRVIG